MDFTLALEVSALVAVGFEFIKRLLQNKFSSTTGDYVFRGLLIAIAFGYATVNYFYLSGHPEIVKVATQIAIQASGIWALIIKLVPNKKVEDKEAA